MTRGRNPDVSAEQLALSREQRRTAEARAKRDAWRKKYEQLRDAILSVNAIDPSRVLAAEAATRASQEEIWRLKSSLRSVQEAEERLRKRDQFVRLQLVPVINHVLDNDPESQVDLSAALTEFKKLP